MTEFSESMSMEDFDALPGGRKGREPSFQQKAVRAMLPNTVLQFSHEGLDCKWTNGRRIACSFNHMIASERRRGQHGYIAKHLPDGRVAVACLAKD